MSSEFQIAKHLEWCTLLPTIDCARKSPIFLLKDHQCSFRLAFGKHFWNKWWYNMYVELKEGDSEWIPSEVHLKVGFKKQTNLDFDQQTFTVSGYGTKEIWLTEKNDMESKLPHNYLDGNWIKFHFYFKDVLAYLLKFPLKNVEHTVDVSVEGLSKDFSGLLEAGLDHDTEIKCGESSIKTHKLVLSARSEVFRAMFQNNMKEGRSGVVEIQEMDASYVQEFVRYLYTDAMPEMTVEKATIFYEAGDKYAVKSLMLRCADYLYFNLSEENAYRCFALADAHSDQALKDRVVMFMVQEKMYLRGDDWEIFTEQFPKEALKIYKLVHGI